MDSLAPISKEQWTVIFVNTAEFIWAGVFGVTYKNEVTVGLFSV